MLIAKATAVRGMRVLSNHFDQGGDIVKLSERREAFSFNAWSVRLRSW